MRRHGSAGFQGKLQGRSAHPMCEMAFSRSARCRWYHSLVPVLEMTRFRSRIQSRTAGCRICAVSQMQDRSFSPFPPARSVGTSGQHGREVSVSLPGLWVSRSAVPLRGRRRCRRSSPERPRGQSNSRRYSVETKAAGIPALHRGISAVLGVPLLHHARAQRAFRGELRG